MTASYAERLAVFAAQPCGHVMHPWAPESCLQGCALCWVGTLQRALPLYAAVHGLGMVPQLVKCRSAEDVVRLLQRAGVGTARSSVFLSGVAGSLIASACLLHRVAGRSRVALTGAVPGMLCAWSLAIERPGRRRDLASYVFNQAVRILWRRAEAARLAPAVPRGDLVLLCLALALVAPLRSMGSRTLRGQLRMVLDALLPPDETATGTAGAVASQQPPPASAYILLAAWKRLQDSNSRVKTVSPDVLVAVLLRLRRRVPPRVVRAMDTRTPVCTHHGGCASSALAAGVHGTLVGTAVGVLRDAVARMRGQRPPAVVRPALMLGALPVVYRAVRCSLRAVGLRGHSVDAIAGLAAGTTLSDVRGMGLATYVFGKVVEAWYFELVARKKAPVVPYGDFGLFSAGAAVIVHFAIFEPHILPPSYRRFLDNVTKGRLMQVNPERLPFAQPA